MKLLKLDAFKEKQKKVKENGEEKKKTVIEHHGSQMEKEVIDNLRQIGAKTCKDHKPVSNPIEGHEVTKEYRTKMTDWMVEVCSSFKCTERTYFVAVQIFDKYLTKIYQNKGKALQNKDVHRIGVTSMFLASKYEDVLPLSSKIVSEKIAHRAIPAKEILKKE